MPVGVRSGLLIRWSTVRSRHAPFKIAFALAQLMNIRTMFVVLHAVVPCLLMPITIVLTIVVTFLVTLSIAPVMDYLTVVYDATR